MTQSVLFRVPTNDGFSVSGFVPASGEPTVIATYVKAESVTGGAKVYECQYAGKTRKVTINVWHGANRPGAAGQAATEVLKALGLAEVKPAAKGGPKPVTDRDLDARIEGIEKSIASLAGIVAQVAEASKPVTRGRKPASK